MAFCIGHHVIVFTYREQVIVSRRNHMNTEIQNDAGAETAMERELCDKCGSGMDLQGSAYGFQRWRCPKCQQVVGIDRDPEVGSRFQIARGQPWNYSPDAFKN
jgi:ribosomal protein S27AE